MARFHWISIVLPLAVLACGTEKTNNTAEPIRVIRVTTDPGDDGNVSAIADAHTPAHRFAPRAMAPTPPQPTVVPVPNDQLPLLKNRLTQCYGTAKRPTSQIAQPSQPKLAPLGMVRRESPTGSLGEGRQHTPSPKTAAAPAPVKESSKRVVMEDAMPQGVPMEMTADNALPPSAEPLAIASGDTSSAVPYDSWGASIYLSNDDSMSLSSAQRVIYAIDNFLPLPTAHIRPHELLNYFSFQKAAVAPGRDFSLLPTISDRPDSDGNHTLALSVAGRSIEREQRRNAVLTWVIDRSGSMAAEGRMAYLKKGLMRSLAELKNGDMIHMVLFDHEVCTPIENFVVGRDDIKILESAIQQLAPKGATDLHSGLTTGYAIADATYQPSYNNRLLLITDALVNTGITDDSLISTVAKHYDTRRIRLSGVGVGRDFNDALLDRLTERGRGAYVFLGSEAEVDAVFGERFISLLETTALDVHFRLHLPPSLRMNVFYGEESSTEKHDVQAIHYFAGTTQLFLSDLKARDNQLRPQDDIMFTVEYQDPTTQEKRIHEEAFRLGDIAAQHALNVEKGRLMMTWIDLISALAMRQPPKVYRYKADSHSDPEAWQLCEDGRALLQQRAQHLSSDAETTRVLQLFDKYCSRFERPRNPVKRQVETPTPSWPSALPEPAR